jgi:hypothetical protein
MYTIRKPARPETNQYDVPFQFRSTKNRGDVDANGSPMERHSAD